MYILGDLNCNLLGGKKSFQYANKYTIFNIQIIIPVDK